MFLVKLRQGAKRLFFVYSVKQYNRYHNRLPMELQLNLGYGETYYDSGSKTEFAPQMFEVQLKHTFFIPFS